MGRAERRSRASVRALVPSRPTIASRPRKASRGTADGAHARVLWKQDPRRDHAGAFRSDDQEPHLDGHAQVADGPGKCRPTSISASCLVLKKNRWRFPVGESVAGSSIFHCLTRWPDARLGSSDDRLGMVISQCRKVPNKQVLLCKNENE